MNLLGATRSLLGAGPHSCIRLSSRRMLHSTKSDTRAANLGNLLIDENTRVIYQGFTGRAVSICVLWNQHII